MKKIQRAARCLLAILIFSRNSIFPQEFFSAPHDEILYEEIIPDSEDEKKHSGAQGTNHISPGLPGWERAEVERFRKAYLSPERGAELFVILKNGEQYRHYVRRRLLEENMPLALEYIPVIESSYRANAAPKDGRSVGLWQFLENSIEGYLKKNEWLDERLDPWKSTDAALKKLKANYKTFGDWLLAIAAYNCGAGAVKRALEKSREKNFWALCEKKLIPEHAINYVPRLLAISDIAANEEFYGADLPEFSFDIETYSPLDDFEYVEVSSQISLKRLAMELRMDEKILLDMNPALFRGVTPPNESYEIRLPARMEGAARDALFALMSEKKNADTE